MIIEMSAITQKVVIVIASLEMLYIEKIKLTNTIYSVTMNVTLISVRSQEPHQMFLFR